MPSVVWISTECVGQSGVWLARLHGCAVLVLFMTAVYNAQG
jgi:hypothetical protein